MKGRRIKQLLSSRYPRDCYGAMSLSSENVNETFKRRGFMLKCGGWDLNPSYAGDVSRKPHLISVD